MLYNNYQQYFDLDKIPSKDEKICLINPEILFSFFLHETLASSDADSVVSSKIFIIAPC